MSFWERIAEIELKDFKLPLILNFNSSRENGSPYAGKSFAIFPLDSIFLQTDEKTFLMTQPNGLNNWFGRQKLTDTVLKGSSNWAAEIKDKCASVWTSCDWRFDYVNARIVSMSNKNQRIDFIRSGGADGAVTELRCGGVSVLRVETNPMTREIKALVYGGGKRIAIGWGDRPHFQVSGTKVAVNGTDRCLTRLTTPEFEQQFSYGVTEKMQPTLKIANSDGTWHEFSWDAATKLLLSDVTAENSWRYTIKPGATARDYAAIERKDEKNGAVEAWKTSPGRDETFANGVWTKRYTFVGGPLANRLRKIERQQGRDGKTTVVYRAIFDEKARLVREIDEKGRTTTYQYDQHDNQIEASRDGRLLWIKKYNAQGKAIDIFEPKETDPEILKQLEEREKALIARVVKTVETESKDEALQELGFFYVHEMRDVEKARKIAPSITTHLNRFNVLLHAIDHNRDLKLADQVAGYRALL
ncbi:MAG: RHS repeat protein, partial [Verrucomicrobiae bacterium]|nr:RHS repeat protein [Verrucomicrobiae bacterium]